MELNEEHLKQKALLLLRRERELFELRMKYEQVTLWLQLTQALPQAVAGPHVAITEVHARIRKTLIEGLRLQRVLFLELEGELLRPVLPPGPPRALASEAVALLKTEAAGFCNNQTDCGGAALAEALGLTRFIWGRIDVPGRLPVVLAAGFNRAKAKFQLPFEASDAAHLRNATQHVQGLIGNALLVQELECERDRLQQTNETLERRDRELYALAEELRAANETLEQRVRDRTHELGRRNRDMRLVLDNVAQSLVTIDTAGRLAEERSARVDEWFGSYEGTPSFVDYIANIDPLFAESFALGHEALIEQILPPEVCLKQLPTRLRAGERVFNCTYFPLSQEPGGRGLLIVIDDVTAQVRQAQEEAEQSELLSVFQGFTRDRDGFFAFFEEASDLVQQLAGVVLDEAARSRALHTLKGTAAMMGTKVIAELCHRAEEELAMEGPDGIEITIKLLQERWGVIRQTLEAVAGERAKGMIEVPSRALEQLAEDVRGGASVDDIANRLTFLRLESIERPLRRLSQYALALAQRMGKGGLSVVLEAAETRIDPRRFGGLWSALVHVVRNAIDHGIEPPEERLARGKPAGGRVFLHAFQTSRELVLEIADDGSGIDWDRVRQLTAARGMPHESEADLLHAILSDGFSTSPTVTMMSGRGIGMSAVRQEVLALGGTLSVRSEAGCGTRWRMTFPPSVTRRLARG